MDMILKRAILHNEYSYSKCSLLLLKPLHFVNRIMNFTKESLQNSPIKTVFRLSWSGVLPFM